MLLTIMFSLYTMVHFSLPLHHYVLFPSHLSLSLSCIALRLFPPQVFLFSTTCRLFIHNNNVRIIFTIILWQSRSRQLNSFHSLSAYQMERVTCSFLRRWTNCSFWNVKQTSWALYYQNGSINGPIALTPSTTLTQFAYGKLR